MKKYFVYFTYRKILPHSQERTNPMLTFEIISLQDIKSNEITPNLGPSVSKDGALLALFKLGYTEDVTVIHMNPL